MYSSRDVAGLAGVAGFACSADGTPAVSRMMAVHASIWCFGM